MCFVCVHQLSYFGPTKFKIHYVAQQFLFFGRPSKVRQISFIEMHTYFSFGLIIWDIQNSITCQNTLHLLLIPVGLLVLPCTRKCKQSPPYSLTPFFSCPGQRNWQGLVQHYKKIYTTVISNFPCHCIIGQCKETIPANFYSFINIIRFYLAQVMFSTFLGRLIPVHLFVLCLDNTLLHQNVLAFHLMFLFLCCPICVLVVDK